MFNRFRMWSENGKYYKKNFWGRKREITKEEFKFNMKENKITSLQLTNSGQLGLETLIKIYQKHDDNDTSEYGKRVEVLIIKGEQQASSEKNGGVDFYCKLEIRDEETGETISELTNITIKAEGVTGPLTDNGVFYPELYRSLYQVAFNGALSNETDYLAMKEAFKGEAEKMAEQVEEGA